MVTEGFDRHVDADSVAEPEAIHDGSRRTRYTYAHAVDVVFLDAAGERRAGDPHDPNGREVDARDAGAPIDGKPYLSRMLRTEAMEAQRREQAEHALRHAPRDLGEGVVLRRFDGGKGVKPTAHAREIAPACQPANILRVNTSRDGVGQSEEALPLREANEALLGLNCVILLPHIAMWQ